MSFKRTSLAIALNTLLCISLSGNAAYLERAQDLDHFYFGQRGLGLDQAGTLATDIGHLEPILDTGIALEMHGEGKVSANTGAGSTSVTGTQHLSIFATDTTQATYLIDAFVELYGNGSYTNGTAVTVQNDAFDQAAYADVWVQQSFRILPGAGESVGDAVRISVSAEAFLQADNTDPILIQDAILDGLYPNPFTITYNSGTLFSLPGAIHTGQNLYSNSFIGQIGDIISFEGPTVLARLTLQNAAFDSEEDWNASARASFYGSVGVTPVPEPETWAMLLTGLGLIGLQSIRKPGNRLDA